MHQSYFADANREYDGRSVAPGGDFLIKVKRTSNARDLRGALRALAYALEKEPASAQAMLVLKESNTKAFRTRHIASYPADYRPASRLTGKYLKIRYLPFISN